MENEVQRPTLCRGLEATRPQTVCRTPRPIASA